MEYANAAWHPFKKKDIKIIENVQRRATKQIPGMRDLSYKDRLMTIQMPTLLYRRLRGDMIETFKIIHQLYDPNVTRNFLPMSEQPYTRGHSQKIKHQYSRLIIRKESFSPRVASLWNELPEEVVNAPGIKAFERRLDKAWEKKEFKYNAEDAQYQSNITSEGMIDDDDLALED